jgi:glycosyltransferase involved in cell wall biosynthesis
MRIVQLSTYDLYGGAGIAAVRLHRALRATGEDSRMLVRQRRSTDVAIAQPGGAWMHGWLRGQRRLDRMPLAFASPAARGFSLGWVPEAVARATRALSPDVVHVHWTADGFMRFESLGALRAPVVWTLHDMWAFTGGCHYAGECTGYAVKCGRCPLLGARREHDWSRSGWERRRRVLAWMRAVFVAPSQWMATRVRASALLADADVRVIANGLDTAIFAPQDRLAVRAALGLPTDAFLLLTGAADWSGNPRKGFAPLRAALRALREQGAHLEVIVFGGAAGVATELEGFRMHPLGVLAGDAALVRAYAAADVFVLPSLEDNLPNTAIEALAVGVPVVAFEVGGIPDIVEHERNGLLVPSGRPDELARAIARMIAETEFRAECARCAREKALEAFSVEKMAAQHQVLYRELVNCR